MKEERKVKCREEGWGRKWGVITLLSLPIFLRYIRSLHSFISFAHFLPSLPSYNSINSALSTFNSRLPSLPPSFLFDLKGDHGLVGLDARHIGVVHKSEDGYIYVYMNINTCKYI